MNKYAKCLYDYLMENGFKEFTNTPAYISVSDAYIREETEFLQMLTPEQQEQFSRYQDQEARLEVISMQHLFIETLRLVRGLFSLC